MPNIPYGSPLDPRKRPVGALPPSVVPVAPVAAPVSPVALPAAPAAIVAGDSPSLPKAPPVAKRLNPFDREHISATLAEISKGFTSSNSFLGGLSGAASNVADQTAAWRKAELGTTETGGPDSAFEIHTDQYGNRTYTPIKAVQDYVTAKDERKDKAKNAPKPGESSTALGDAAYAVSKLSPAAQPGAWRLALSQLHDQGYDVSTAPPEWSPTFASYATNRNVGARAGAQAEATASYRQEQGRRADLRFADTHRSTEQRITASQHADARGDAREARLRSAPPSKKGNSDLDYILNH